MRTAELAAVSSATTLSATSEEPHKECSTIRVTTIQPSNSNFGIDWGEFWRYRELLFFLAWRDIKVRYKQASLGVAWAVLQPLVTMAIFSAVFGRVAALTSATQGIPYSIYVCAGLLPWLFFSNSVNSSANSLIGNSNLITKVYFPRIFIPLSSIGVGLVDLTISLVLIGIAMIAYAIPPTVNLLLFPIVLAGIILASTGVGMLLSALTVTYRDVRYVVPFMLQAWMFATPVIYPPSVISEDWRQLFALNPLSGLISGFRSCFLGTAINVEELFTALGVSVILVVVGTATFRKFERRFADTI